MKVLITKKQIEEKTNEIASIIEKKYSNAKYIKLIGLLKGSMVFMSDLMKKINLPVKIDFMEVSSYGDLTNSSGNIKILKDLSHDISGEEVIIVEDIIDTGLTLNHIYELLKSRKPESLTIASFLVKDKKHKMKHPIDFYGFKIEDDFVIGYGLDYKGYYRNLPFIAEFETGIDDEGI